MANQIQIVPEAGIDEGMVTLIRTLANEVLERKGFLSPPPYLCIMIWKTMKGLQDFYQREKEALGILTEGETDFLATHDAWRGYPRIHICHERLTQLADTIIQGIVHHEISHALHHGTSEFYTFRFSKRLQDTGTSCGLNLSLLQQCVYFLSVAIKDQEVVQWLAEIGLGFSQRALLEHLISDTEEERWIWEEVQNYVSMKKIALASFLKTLLPIEAMISIGSEEAQILSKQWNRAYRWLSESDRKVLLQLSQYSINNIGKTFQERLEDAALRLILA